MYQLNSLHGEEPTYPPRECNIQDPFSQFKYRTSSPKTSPEVSTIMVRFNHHALDNGDVELCPSEFPVLSYSEYVPYPYNTPIKSIDDNEMDHLL